MIQENHLSPQKKSRSREIPGTPPGRTWDPQAPILHWHSHKNPLDVCRMVWEAGLSSYHFSPKSGPRPLGPFTNQKPKPSWSLGLQRFNWKEEIKKVMEKTRNCMTLHLPPHPRMPTVTTRMMIFLSGSQPKSSFAILTEWGVDPMLKTLEKIRLLSMIRWKTWTPTV